ncbi:hypothetical protein T4A_954 [Trichinella pseudospiralis]|uniref:Uncharacterized protein n=1 Tax=Trichinella pseudospiralis TaxID=6337 RepID=A0A0V1EME7_TRIPS|nr:hypothetical protein T4A_954 [Trichinella pseudospiralis]
MTKNDSKKYGIKLNLTKWLFSFDESRVFQIQTVSKAMSCWQRKSQLYASSQSRQLCSNLPVPRLCQLHGRLIPRSATLLAQLRILISALGKNKRLKLTEYVVKAFEEGALLSLVDYVAGATSSSSDHSSLSPPSTSTLYVEGRSCLTCERGKVYKYTETQRLKSSQCRFRNTSTISIWTLPVCYCCCVVFVGTSRLVSVFEDTRAVHLLAGSCTLEQQLGRKGTSNVRDNVYGGVQIPDDCHHRQRPAIPKCLVATAYHCTGHQVGIGIPAAIQYKGCSEPPAFEDHSHTNIRKEANNPQRWIHCLSPVGMLRIFSSVKADLEHVLSTLLRVLGVFFNESMFAKAAALSDYLWIVSGSIWPTPTRTAQ